MLDTSQQSSTTTAFQERKNQHRWLVDYLTWNNHPAAQAVKDCHQMWRVYTCDDGHDTIRPSKSCHHPLCPWCQSSRAKRLQQAFTTAAAGAENKHLRFLVLTVPDTPALDFQQLRSQFTRLTRHKWWKQRVKGGAYCLETTWSPWFGWHPHINVIIEKHTSVDLNIEELRELWCTITKGARQLFIANVTPGSWAELAKYTVKGSDLIGYPDQIAEYLTQTKRQRLAATFGSWWGRKLTPTDLPVMESRLVTQCSTCNKPATARGRIAWLEDIIWDGSNYLLSPTWRNSHPKNKAPTSLPLGI